MLCGGLLSTKSDSGRVCFAVLNLPVILSRFVNAVECRRKQTKNIIQGDALTLTTTNGQPITFPEWGYLGSGKFQRRDFHFHALTQRASNIGTLFELFEEEQLFVPVKTFSPMSIEELAI